MKEDATQAVQSVSGSMVRDNAGRIGNLTQILLYLLASSPAALAHPGHADGGGFMAAFGHPIGGFDHFIAMLAVGLWAAQIGGRAIGFVPLAFLAMMTAGGALGWSGVSLPLVEAGLLSSVVALGLLIAAAAQWPTLWAMALVGMFAVLHGHAHGAEMPVGTSPLVYASGFLLAAGLLHLTGLCAGLLAQRSGSPVIIRFAGAVIVLAGVYLWS